MGSNPLIALEDRILVLQDQVDVLSKTFDPNQPRDGDGKWTPGGGGGSLKGAAAWLSPSRVAEAVKAGDYGARAKDALAATVATLITTYNNDDQATEAVKQSILELSTGLKITQYEAREKVVGVLNKLRAMRAREKPGVAKAEDAVLELLTKLIKLLDELEFDE